MKQFSGFFMALFLVLVTVGTFGQNVLKFKAPSSHGLPFIEYWNQGTFIFNDWELVPANTNWTISIIVGNPLPSADFTSEPIQLDYAFSLETPLFCLYPYSFTCAKIWCDFDYKLVNLNSTGDEKLFVDLFSNGEWKNRAWFSNTDDKDWTPMHVYLSDGSDSTFKVRFRAKGVNSADILHWYVDNIKIYIKCNPPVDLAIQDVTDQQVSLTWNEPECGTEGPEQHWIHWDDSINYTGIGTCYGCIFDVAARWDTSQIQSLEGGAVTKIAFFPYSVGTANFRIRVWQGQDAATLLVDQQAPSEIYGEWNVVDINNPFPIDITQDLWIGCNVEMIGGFPVGCDAGPAVVGYGDMLRWENGDWDELSNYGYNYNWNIQGYIEALDDDTTNAPNTLLGYNLYRSDDFQISWMKLNTALIADTNFVDHVSGYQEYCYYVSSIFQIIDWFTCESDSSNIVCADVVSDINMLNSERISIYPNPARDNIIIKSPIPIKSIELFNYTGQTVFARHGANENTITVNVSSLEPGVYFTRITTGKVSTIAKVTIVR